MMIIKVFAVHVIFFVARSVMECLFGRWSIALFSFTVNFIPRQLWVKVLFLFVPYLRRLYNKSVKTVIDFGTRQVEKVCGPLSPSKQHTDTNK